MRINRKRASLLTVCMMSLALTACATKTIGPMVASDNTYIVSREEGLFPSGNEPLLREALQEARIFCSSLDREMEVIDTEEHRQIIGAYPKATVTFSCN